MKKTGLMLLLSGIIVMAYQITTRVIVSYRWEKKYLQFWELADKSITISAKQKYISQFVNALEAGYTNNEFSSHDAIWLKTLNNSFEANLTAIKTLASRLDEIREMNPTSFEYNTAIQQITAQEQGQATNLISVLSSCYELKSYPLVWNWIGGIVLPVWMLLIIIGICVYLDSFWRIINIVDNIL